MTDTRPSEPNSSESPNLGADEPSLASPNDTENIGTNIASAANDSIIGTKLGDRYEVLSVIARGGMGVVYRARHILLDKIVAIKLLNDTYLHDPGAFARFQHEAKVASQLSHPNIVTVHDFGITEDKMLYLVMDFIEGQTLGEILDDQANLPVARVIEITRQLCDGLEYAHDQGLIHRDLKPNNLMIVQTKDGQDLVKILDFGLAKFMVEGKQQALSQTGYVLGTGFYMSPEQCRGKPADVRSEIYAIGCVLYETITGLPPFVGENLLETCQKHIEDTAVSMGEARPDLEIPEALESIVQRALQKDPQARFQSASDLKSAIEGLQEKSGTEARAATDSIISAAVSTTAPTTSTDSSVAATVAMPLSAVASSVTPAPDKNDRFSKAPVLVALVAVVIIGAGASYYSVNYKTTPRVPEQQSTENKAIVVPNAAAQGSPNDPVWTKNFQTAVTAFDKEQYPAAEKLLQRSIVEARHSQNKSELLLALHKLEDVLYVQKKFKEADLLDQELHRTAASATVAPAKESQDDRIAHLALACHKNGQCDTAISLLQHSIEISKRMYGAHSLKTAERLSELAMVYMALDQPDDAQPLLNEVMEIKASHKERLQQRKNEESSDE